MGISLRFTTPDLACLPDTLDDTRYEIIGGELYVAHQPQWHHQYAANEAARVLTNWNHETGLGRTAQAPGLTFGPYDSVAPDVVWVSRSRLSALLDEGGHLRAAPELVIEVLSPGPANEDRDREVKLKLYSRQGVREYWIIDCTNGAGLSSRERGPGVGCNPGPRRYPRISAAARIHLSGVHVLGRAGLAASTASQIPPVDTS